MRTFFLYLILAVLCWNCKSEAPTSIIVSVLSDKTDTIIPSPKMAHIKPFFEDPKYDNGTRTFRFQTITNTNVNKAYKAELKAFSVFGNSLQQKSDVSKFYKRIDTLLSRENDIHESYQNSSIIIPLIIQLKKVKAAHTNTKIVLLYSDLFEASDVFNVYRSKDRYLLNSKIESVIANFKSKVAIPQLTGVELYIIYYPKTMNDNRLFQQMSFVYRELFKDTGLKLHIGIDNPITP